MTNTVVKFCEQTGLSGNVVVAASAGEPAVLTAVADDTVGGNADCRGATPVEGTYALAGSFTHVGCQLRYATADGFPVVSVPSLVAGSKGAGVVRVPVSVSGSRTGEFAVNWTATDLGASMARTTRRGADRSCGIRRRRARSSWRFRSIRTGRPRRTSGSCSR